MRKAALGLIVLVAALAFFYSYFSFEEREEPRDPLDIEAAKGKRIAFPTQSHEVRTVNNAPPSEIPLPRRDPTPAAEAPANSAPPPPSIAAPLKDSLLRRPDGSFHFFDQRMAIKACAAKGMRLPTIRELAVLAKQKGAKGILEKSETRESDEAAGAKLVRALTGSSGATDEFYYSAKGYNDEVHREVGDSKWVGARDGRGHNLGPLSYVKPGSDPAEGRDPFGNLAYWSASEAYGHHEEADPELHSFYLLDMYGEIHDHYRTVLGMARCLRDR